MPHSARVANVALDELLPLKGLHQDLILQHGWGMMGGAAAENRSSKSQRQAEKPPQSPALRVARYAALPPDLWARIWVTLLVDRNITRMNREVASADTIEPCLRPAARVAAQIQYHRVPKPHAARFTGER